MKTFFLLFGLSMWLVLVVGLVLTRQFANVAMLLALTALVECVSHSSQRS